MKRVEALFYSLTTYKQRRLKTAYTGIVILDTIKTTQIGRYTSNDNMLRVVFLATTYTGLKQHGQGCIFQIMDFFNI